MVGSFFHTAPGSSKSKNGEDIYCAPATTPVSRYQVLALVDGEFVIADKDTPPHCNRVQGIATNSTNTAGQSVCVQSTGEITNNGWNFTIGDRLYLGSNGAIMTSIDPSDALMVPIGHAVSSDTILLDIKPSIRRTN